MAKGSRAERAGLRAGDLLMQWNGKPLRRVPELARWIEGSKKGAATVQYARRKKIRRLFDRRPWLEGETTIRWAAPERSSRRRLF